MGSKLTYLFKSITFLLGTFSQISMYLLFLTLLGHPCFVQPFASCGKGGCSLLPHTGFSLPWFLLLRSTDSRHPGSVVVAHGPQSTGPVIVVNGQLLCSMCGILPDQPTNQYPLHCQGDSYPLLHQGSLLLGTIIADSLTFCYVVYSEQSINYLTINY